MFCEKCGAKIDDDALFCPRCGHRFNSTTVNEPKPKTKTSLAKKRIPLDPTQKMIRAVSAVVIAISLLIVSLTGITRFVVKGPEDTVMRFFDSCNNLNFNGLLDCLDPETAREYKFAVDMIIGMSGLDIDSDSVSELGGMFSKYKDNEMKVLDMQTEYIKNGQRKSDPFGIHKLTATDAEVICTYIMSGEEQTDTFVLHKYSGKWKLEGE
jgi:hypothetical protein